MFRIKLYGEGLGDKMNIEQIGQPFLIWNGLSQKRCS